MKVLIIMKILKELPNSAESECYLCLADNPCMRKEHLLSKAMQAISSCFMQA